MKTFGKTHVGLIREINEDNFFVSQESIGKLPNLFIIADGMGGHKAGEIASMLAIEAFVDTCKKASNADGSIEEIFIKAAQDANNVIYDKSVHTFEMNGMGTTLVACTLTDDMLYVANIGDSRLYVTHDGLQQVTIDHSYVEGLVRNGEITREESYHHPARNKITRALGVGYDVQADIFKLSNKHLKNVLLCSDGLTNMLMDERIDEILMAHEDLSQKGQRLMDEALYQGGLDNITVIVIELYE